MRRSTRGNLALLMVLFLLLGMLAGCGADAPEIDDDDVIGEEPGDTDEPGNTDEPNVDDDSTDPPEVTECPFPPGLVLPQIYIMGSISYSQAERENIQANVIEPIIADNEGTGWTIVYIGITRDFTDEEFDSIVVEVVYAQNDGTDAPIVMGFVHHKEDGEFPYWVQDVMD